MTNPDLSLGPVLFMNEQACFFMTMFLNQTQPVMHLSPRVRFDCAWLFAILLRLFSVLQNVLLRSSYFCSLPGGRNFCTQQGDLCTAAYVLFVVRLHSNAYF